MAGWPAARLTLRAKTSADPVNVGPPRFLCGDEGGDERWCRSGEGDRDVMTRALAPVEEPEHQRKWRHGDETHVDDHRSVGAVCRDGGRRFVGGGNNGRRQRED